MLKRDTEGTAKLVKDAKVAVFAQVGVKGKGKRVGCFQGVSVRVMLRCDTEGSAKHAKDAKLVKDGKAAVFAQVGIGITTRISRRINESRSSWQLR